MWWGRGTAVRVCAREPDCPYPSLHPWPCLQYEQNMEALPIEAEELFFCDRCEFLTTWVDSRTRWCEDCLNQDRQALVAEIAGLKAQVQQLTETEGNPFHRELLHKALVRVCRACTHYYVAMYQETQGVCPQCRMHHLKTRNFLARALLRQALHILERVPGNSKLVTLIQKELG